MAPFPNGDNGRSDSIAAGRVCRCENLQERMGHWDIETTQRYVG